MRSDEQLVERLPSLLRRLESNGVAVPQEERGGWKLYENEAALYELKQLAPDMARKIVAQADRITALREALEEILKHAPSLPKQYAWSGQAEALFDNGLRHKRGKKPFDYLKSWLSMLRPFAYATQDDSWGEMEKLLCIVMRNYARVAAATDKARAALTTDEGEEG
jgi:hypothetical protein